jgi:endogenous inhibitor of DNA gyrase (YacG/DUF329 family)
MECPICQTPIRPRAENPAFPFCSQRCQLVDLGRWLDGDYRIPGEQIDDVALPADGDGHGNGTDEDDLRH